MPAMNAVYCMAALGCPHIFSRKDVASNCPTKQLRRLLELNENVNQKVASLPEGICSCWQKHRKGNSHSELVPNHTRKSIRPLLGNVEEWVREVLLKDVIFFLLYRIVCSFPPSKPFVIVPELVVLAGLLSFFEILAHDPSQRSWVIFWQAAKLKHLHRFHIFHISEGP